MPFAPVNDRGAVMEYIDSGAPPNSTTYSTLVLIHGVTFHSGIFSPMLLFAAANNIRLVLLNLRDAGQSTPLADMNFMGFFRGDKDTLLGFMKERVLELANFFWWFITTEQIPPLQELDGQRIGGLSLATWSASNSYGVSFLGLAEVIPLEQRRLLEDYMRTFVIYDPVNLALGVPSPPLEDLYNVMDDPAASSDQKSDAWLPKILGNHTKSGPHVVQALSAKTLADLPPVRDFLRRLQTFPDPATYDLKALEPHSDPGIGRRAIMPMIVGRDIVLQNTLKALTRGYSANDTSDKYFPKLKMECVSCAESFQECAYGVYWLKRTVLEHRARKVGLREITFRSIEGASHAWHWFHPERAVKYFAKIV